jgi:tight adherence protein C
VGSTKLITEIVAKFNLSRLVASEGTQEKLQQAGMRGPTPMIVFNFFRFVMPFVVFAAALLYVFVIAQFSWDPMMKLAAAVGAALAGFYLPDVFITNIIQKRQKSIMGAFPDALDLLLICVESGMSVEAGFAKVAAEIGQASPELAEEFALTTAELSYLPDRKQAFENLAKRCGHPGVKAVATALNQAERYGTPLGQALRICAQENREMRMNEAEKKAAALPAKLTVPMILFFLPCLFVVILGPAIMKISKMF